MVVRGDSLITWQALGRGAGGDPRFVIGRDWDTPALRVSLSKSPLKRGKGMTLSLYEPPSARGWLHPAPTDLAPAHPRLEASHNCGTAVPWHLPIRSSGGEFDSRSSPPFAGYSFIQV